MPGTTTRADLLSDQAVFWGLENSLGRQMPPRRFTNGLTQRDSVADIIKAFRDGATDVFFHANLGSGKSLVALHTIANMGRGIVVVPTKNLQDQYADDYEGKYVIRNPRTRQPVRIRVMKGRGNFECKHHKKSAASPDLVCTKPLPTATPRWRLARDCPDWSPVYKGELAQMLSEKVYLHDEAAEDVAFQDDIKDGRAYEAIWGEHLFVPRGNPCPYYAQYGFYDTAEAIVMNQAKWTAETSLGRKPRLDVEIFDEADFFLDSLGQTVEISEFELDKLQRQFMQFRKLSPDLKQKVSKKDQTIQAWLQKARKDLKNHEELGEVDPPLGLVEALAKLYESMEGDDAAKKAGELRDILEHPEAVFCVKREDKYLFTVGEPKVILRSMLARSGPRRLWMSATLQDKAILRDVYGFKNPVIIEGETAYQGRLFVCTPDEESYQEHGPVAVRWESWYGPEGGPLREGFARALDFIKKHARGPTAYIIHGKGYLGSISESSKGARHVLRLLEKERESDETLERFMKGEDKEIASTRMNRGVDFKGALCRDLVLIKMPIPDISDPKFQAIRKKFREKYGEEIGDGVFWRFVRDTARRTVLQQVGRGLRSPDDWVRVWTTDDSVLRFLTHRFPDKKIVTHLRVKMGQRKLPPE